MTEKLSVKERAQLIMREPFYGLLALGLFKFPRKLSQEEKDKFNAAVDMEINSNLEKYGFKLLKCVLPENSSEQSIEEVYEQAKKNR